MSRSEIIRRYKSLIKMSNSVKGMLLHYVIVRLRELRKNYPEIVGRN